MTRVRSEVLQAKERHCAQPEIQSEAWQAKHVSLSKRESAKPRDETERQLPAAERASMSGAPAKGNAPKSEARRAGRRRRRRSRAQAPAFGRHRPPPSVSRRATGTPGEPSRRSGTCQARRTSPFPSSASLLLASSCTGAAPARRRRRPPPRSRQARPARSAR